MPGGYIRSYFFFNDEPMLNEKDNKIPYYLGLILKYVCICLYREYSMEV